MNIGNDRLDSLFEAVLKLRTKEECKSFFEDICTIKEMQDLSQRLEVAVMLVEGSSYQQISTTTGASTATISRVSRALNYGSGGYGVVLDNRSGNKTDYEKVLTSEEKISLRLRELYSSYGFKQYRMSKFEEYDLYVKNKDFLVSDSIITFNDTDGRLLALKPDVTLSIIKNTRAEGGILRAYYSENVYRAEGGTRSFREIMQTGVECIGDIELKDVFTVVSMACESLSSLSGNTVLEISHLDVLSAILSHLAISDAGKKRIISFISEKNSAGVMSVLDSEGKSTEAKEMLSDLISLHGSRETVLPILKKLALNKEISHYVDELTSLLDYLEEKGLGDRVCVDFSVINNTSYYNGIAFRGFAQGAAREVLLGGQYDKLLSRMKRAGRGVGFAVYVDELARLG